MLLRVRSIWRYAVRMVIVSRENAPPHLFSIPELDFSSDLFVEPLGEHWFRLAAITRGNDVDLRGVRDVIERQSFLLEPGAFQEVEGKLGASTSPIGGMGRPGENIKNLHSAEERYLYRPF